VLGKLPDSVKHPILVGFSDAMDLVFLVGACVLVIAFVLSIRMKEVPLRTQSGLQAARSAAEAKSAAAPAQAAGAVQTEPLRESPALDVPHAKVGPSMPGSEIAVDESYADSESERRNPDDLRTPHGTV